MPLHIRGAIMLNSQYVRIKVYNMVTKIFCTQICLISVERKYISDLVFHSFLEISKQGYINKCVYMCGVCIYTQMYSVLIKRLFFTSQIYFKKKEQMHSRE